jgi:tetratricopeptide (TPR) repeat protein
MKRLSIIVGGYALGVAIMLGTLQPWKKSPPVAAPAPAAPPPPAVPASARDQALLALTALRAGHVEEAQGLLAKAASLDPNLFEVPLFQGHLEMVLGDHAAARRSYTEALRRQPDHAGARASRAAALFELREYAGAVEDASEALKTDAPEADPYFTRAAAYGALDRWEESVRDWTSYLAIRPKEADAWVNRGNAHNRMGTSPRR